ncbi:MAG: DUF3006 family protein [Clostridia bacterium]|nr:DUF3006 family protein [Clostridia bacterium]
MKSLRLKVDRIEEGIAVCYAPDDSDMTDIPLPENLAGTVKDGATLAVHYDGDVIVSVELCDEGDSKSAERRTRLDQLFGRK